MPAAVYRSPGQLSVEHVPVPEPGPDEVLVEVSHCGVCGSDLHMVLDGWGAVGRVGGHEWSGRVALVGTGVQRWSAGDAVVGGAPTGCGKCRYCRHGRISLCERRGPVTGGDRDGAFATYVLAPATELMSVPDERVPLRTAALVEPLAVALHALTLAQVEPGQRVLVTGAGPIGLLVVAALRANGVEDITVSEPAALRRARAEAVGAARSLVPGALQLPAMPNDIVDDPY